MEVHACKLTAKITSLEQALEQKAEKLEQEEQEKKKILVRAQDSLAEPERLQKVIALQEKQLQHIKSLARTIVEQRTDLERFFYDAVNHVKQEIMVSREQYRKEALLAYRQRMREATAGKIKFPPIRTFQKYPHSTNSVYSDMEAAAVWCVHSHNFYDILIRPIEYMPINLTCLSLRTHQPGSKVKISDLTWEQKEQVLCHLFAVMNGQKER